jgi:hypothetical protein
MATQPFRGIPCTVRTEIGNGKKIDGTAGNDWIEVTGSNNHIGAHISTDSGNDGILVGVSFMEIGDCPLHDGSWIVYEAFTWISRTL